MHGIFDALKEFKSAWKMWNVFNRNKNHISDFSDLYFSSYGENSSKIDYILSIKMTITGKMKSEKFEI